MSVIPFFTLNDGLKVRALGFGTYPLKDADTAETILRAIDHGDRLIDTAYNYENEGAVGRAPSQTTISRSELFVTSKLPGRYHAFARALAAVEESLYRTRLGFFDLYLIHWPNPKQDLHVAAWSALFKARKRDLVKSIGVSNFLLKHIECASRETGIILPVNPIEIHPHFPNSWEVAWDANHEIVTEAWSPLARDSEVFQHTEIQDIEEF